MRGLGNGCTVAGIEGGGGTDVLMRQAGPSADQSQLERMRRFRNAFSDLNRGWGVIFQPPPPLHSAAGSYSHKGHLDRAGPTFNPNFCRYTATLPGPAAARMEWPASGVPPLSRFLPLHRYKVGPSWQAEATDHWSQPGTTGQHSSHRVRLMSGSRTVYGRGLQGLRFAKLLI
jgi:hypothetical protein